MAAGKWIRHRRGPTLPCPADLRPGSAGPYPPNACTFNKVSPIPMPTMHVRHTGKECRTIGVHVHRSDVLTVWRPDLCRGISAECVPGSKRAANIPSRYITVRPPHKQLPACEGDRCHITLRGRRSHTRQAPVMTEGRPCKENAPSRSGPVPEWPRGDPPPHRACLWPMHVFVAPKECPYTHFFPGHLCLGRHFVIIRTAAIAARRLGPGSSPKHNKWSKLVCTQRC